MIETFHVEHTAGEDLYVRLFNAAGEVFDFDDGTYKALGDATTPYVRNETHAVNGVTDAAAGSAAFQVAGDVTAFLITGARIRVSGSTGNDGLYTVRSGSAFAGGNTTINVEEAVADETGDGDVEIGVLEHTALGGSTRSGYAVDLDLSVLNGTGQAEKLLLKWYSNSTPADTDDPISNPLVVTVQFGELGEDAVEGFALVSVTSTAGTTAHVVAWLMWRGRRVPLDTDDTCSVTLTEVDGTGTTDAFTVTEADKLGTNANVNDAMQLTKGSPNFTADRMYDLHGSITVDGVEFPVSNFQVMFG